MIKVGIIGASLPVAGELLRILIRHPEVDITTLYEPTMAGRHVSSCHHGFIGESVVNFTDRISPADLDIVFIADESSEGEKILLHSDEWPKLKIVDMSPKRLERREAFGMEYGLSEVNRKSLVRGARMATVPSPAGALVLAAIHPLALHLLLNSDITIDVFANPSILKEMDKNAVLEEIRAMTFKTQSSFKSKITLNFIPIKLSRTMRVKISMQSNIPLAEISKAYESVYDDHNFTFATLSEVGDQEVEGTHKCIVTFSIPQTDSLQLDCVGDCRMRGGAGDAVHLLNLFFALDEKVGLNLKQSHYGDFKGDSQASWFA